MKKILLFVVSLYAGILAWADQPSMIKVTVNGVSFNMIEVKGGRFNMGGTAEQYGCEDDEFPIHVVSLDDYFIGETEVTQRLWIVVMGDDNPSGFTGDLDLPVERVTWNDCQAFAAKLSTLTGMNFRLPTESEWEFAARGGNNTKLYQYSGSNDINEVAWYSANSGAQTHKVAQLKPNELGIYDMSGNVFEWVSDYYGDYDMMPAEAPTGPDSGELRVRRGSCWDGSTNGCRITFRIGDLENLRYNYFGFRIAATGLEASIDVTSADTANPESNGRYNILGQPVSADHKGIVIEDGKKLIQR